MRGQVQWKECCGELQTIHATPRRPHLLEKMTLLRKITLLEKMSLLRKMTLLEKMSLLRKKTSLLGDGGWCLAVLPGAGVQQHIVADEMIPGELK
jgi:hypothetical protein